MAAEMCPLIAIVGPTASGKTALALDIATEIGGEIICADSRTIYRDLDIGTAKPTAAERARVPHHLLDVINPDERLSAAEFKRLAQQAIDDIARRGRVPMLVGGSGLYVDALLYNYEFPPEADPALRAELDGLSLEELVARLIQLDSEAATTVDVQNKRRVIRAIETAGVGRKRSSQLRHRTLLIGLMMSKEIAQQRIAQRVEKMLSEGFIDEVKRVGEHYGWNSQAMNVIGYRACKDTAMGLEPLEVGRERFIAGDLALYKKQMTWFKRNRDIQWIESAAEAHTLVARFLAV